MDNLLRAKNYIYQENIKLPSPIETVIIQHAIMPEQADAIREKIAKNKKPAIRRCLFCNVLFHPRNKEKCCCPEHSKAQTAQKRLEYIQKKKNALIEKICPVCLKTFHTDNYHNRETCSEPCHHELCRRDSRAMEPVKAGHCAEIEQDARDHGMHYADIQKQKTLDMVGKIDVSLGGKI